MSQCKRRPRSRAVMSTLYVSLGLMAAMFLFGSGAVPKYDHIKWPYGYYLIESKNSDDAYIDRRVTWLHWWEANRDGYLMRSLTEQDRAQRKTPHDPELIKQAVEVLIDATRLDGKQSKTIMALRAAATLSLGRIGTDEAVDRLIELTGDTDTSVRSTAWLALGVSGHERARRELLEPTRIKLSERAVRAAAMGMLEPDDGQAIQILRSELIDMPRHIDKRTALQSLRLLNAPGLGSLGYDVVRDTTYSNLASEAILAMAAEPDPAHADMVLSLLNGGPPATRLDLWDTRQMPPTRFAAAQVLGRYDGMFPIHRLRRVLTKHVSMTTYSGEGDYFRGVSLLSLVPLIEPEYEDVFTDALQGQTRQFSRDDRWSHRESESLQTSTYRRRYDPIRGYAAIAMGMYLKRISEEVPPQSGIPIRHEHEAQQTQRRFLNRLSNTLKNQHLHPDLRAAAAMGLMFSGHPEAADRIAQGLDETAPDDVLVIGYGTLALAMLGDQRAVIPARRYIEELDASRNEDGFNDDNPMDRVLGLRAMVLALGLAGDGNAAKALIDAWGSDPWVSLESTRALNWLEDDTLAESLIESIRANPDDSDAVLAAMGLGELLEPTRLSRLSRLVQGGNFTITDRGTAPANIADPGDFNVRKNRTANAYLHGRPRTSRCIRHWQRALSREPYQSPGNVYLYEVMLNP